MASVVVQPAWGRLAAAIVSLAAGACARGAALLEPSPEALAVPAPDSFVVAVETSEGAFDITMYRDWSPLAVDRA